ncbi:unnamed protein product [Brachionus calyciflorus]|uniref:2',3'-cyclic-nucleotide 3'-phosphodiesterase n=1 Tax=Brachionus calyciflorus TaxID=104777 RepID=A0A813UVU7_9BILA|nr:unnamed protein product [Brachionus calyciflorus]
MFQLFPCFDFAPKENKTEEKVAMAKTTKNKIDHELVDLFKTKLAISKEHPFLVDPDTIEFIKNSKVMFINRGLPGSGKSTLSNKIKNLYGIENAVICGGDDYFIDESGNYNFDRDKLHDAHQWAQDKAREACKQGKSPVIVDNTNIKYWEFKPYLSIAKEFNYIVLLIEPRTPHKFDLEKLFLLNKHNVPKEIIKNRLKEYQIIFPIYFGWYLNETDSVALTKTAKECLKEAMKLCENLKSDLINDRLNSDVKILFEFKNETHLHCTSKFIGRSIEKNPLMKEYAMNPRVTESLGTAFTLEIVGFSISKRSIAADVYLNKEQMGPLWGNDLNKLEILEVIQDLNINNNIESKIFDDFEYGARAHVTIGLKPNEKAYRAGIDLMKIKLINKLNYDFNVKNFENDKYEFIYYNDSLCYCKLKNSIKFSTLFTGDY